ncbi:MAG TPA: TIGR03936 family radical SAM-associated protein [Anaerolineales bacterium]|nr:TIGR03936 family radical SAM-associated protein [Anaerolineales bacterium]
MSNRPTFRYRVEFAKTAAMRFTGHLDLHRTWERTFRRAELPLTYTQGFSPHPRMTLAAALPLGCTSEHDLIDVWLNEGEPPEAVEDRLQSAAPPGIRIDRVMAVDPAGPSLPRQVLAAEYHARSAGFPPADEIDRRVQAALAAESLPRTRRGKEYDLRPLIEALGYDREEDQLTMRLSAREGASGRPDEVLEALGLDPALAIATRTRLILKNDVSA